MLREFLGEWLYWPVVIGTIAFVTVSVISNVSLCYTEIKDQLVELKRQIRK